MRILVVEDDEYKREYIEDVLKQRNIEFHVERAINSALRYIHDNHDQIDGIILDLNLPRYDSYNSWKTIISMGGLDIPEEMTRLGIEIPILINSYDAFKVKYDEYLFDTHNIKGETCPHTFSYERDINSFIESIEKGEF